MDDTFVMFDSVVRPASVGPILYHLHQKQSFSSSPHITDTRATATSSFSSNYDQEEEVVAPHTPTSGITTDALAAPSLTSWHHHHPHDHPHSQTQTPREEQPQPLAHPPRCYSVEPELLDRRHLRYIQHSMCYIHIEKYYIIFFGKCILLSFTEIN